uniref:Uncharacterized protein n=1 Tax=Arundo donax TaxID=35708 RepID=A0A0A9G039_ARUDO
MTLYFLILAEGQGGAEFPKISGILQCFELSQY